MRRSRRPSVHRLALAALLVVALAACSGTDGPGDSGAPGGSSVDVDTPELRAMKAEAGIDRCRPGPGGGELPDLTLPCLGGGPDVSLSSLRGPMLINLWYSACGPCREEMPALQKFHERHGEQVPVVGIDVETYPEAAISFADSVGATYPQLADPGGTVFDQPDLRLRQGFPQTIVLDAEGGVAAVEAGGLDDVAEIEQLVTANLEVAL